MSFFAVTEEKIGKVRKHPNADRLDIVTLDNIDFQFIVGKDSCKVGETVIYFPIDSILPPDLLEFLNLTGKLGGNNKDRVRTIKLRGEVSQGIVSTREEINRFISTKPQETLKHDLTSDLGVIKYESADSIPQPGRGPQHHRSNTLPAGVTLYDLEGCERNANAVTQLALGMVSITEKLEGSNWSMKYDGHEFKINTHRHEIITKPYDPPDMFIQTALQQNLSAFAISIFYDEGLNDCASDTNRDFIVLYGELCGPKILKNIYKLPQYRIYLFDIKINSRWLSADKVKHYCEKYGALQVPILAHNVDLVEWVAAQRPVKWEEEKSGEFGIPAASNGRSAINPEIAREGIVIRPMVEQWSSELYGRLILKQRSPEYLAREK